MNLPISRPVGLLPPPDFLAYLPSFLNYGIKIVWITLVLLLTLVFRVRKCDFLLYTVLAPKQKTIIYLKKIFKINSANYTLFQNPPALPALGVCRVFMRIYAKGKMAVDWHNYSHRCNKERMNSSQYIFTSSVLRVQLEAGSGRDCSEHRLVRMAESFEAKWARHAALSFCVSDAMRDDIRRRYGIEFGLFIYDNKRFHCIQPTNYNAEQ